MHMSARELGRLIAATVGVVACAPALWWLVDLTAPAEALGRDDYLVEQPALDDWSRNAIGIAGMAGAVMLLATLAAQWRSSSADRRWVGVIAPLGLLAAYVGSTYAIASRPSGGANIGGGVLVLGLLPVTLGSVLASATFASRIRRGPTA